MGIDYRLYSFPLSGLKQLLVGREHNTEKIIQLLFRNTVKDKEILAFLTGELQRELKKGALTLEGLKNLAARLLTPFSEYQSNMERYEWWFKSREREEYIKNRRRQDALYAKAPSGLAEHLQQRIDAAKKGDKKGLFIVQYITTKIDSKEKEVGFDYSYKNGKVSNLKLFYSPKDQQLYQSMEKWKQKEKEWKKYKQWFQDKEKWMEKHGLGSGRLKLAEKMVQLFNQKELIGSFIDTAHFFQSESSEIYELLKILKKAEDPITAQLEEIEKRRMKYRYKSKEDEELKHKKNKLLMEKFSLSVFDEYERPTLHVFDMAKVDREEVLRATAEFSDKIKIVIRNIVDCGENALIYEVG